MCWLSPHCWSDSKDSHHTGIAQPLSEACALMSGLVSYRSFVECGNETLIDVLKLYWVSLLTTTT